MTWTRPPAVRLLLTALVLLACACKDSGKSAKVRYVPGAAPAVLGVQTPEIKTAIATRLASGTAPTWVSADRWKRVKLLYARFDNSPLWLEADGVKDRAQALVKAIESAPEHALNTAAYPIDSIRRIAQDPQLTKSATAANIADADVLLSAAYTAYAADMLVGQIDPKTVSQAWHIPAESREVDSALVRTLQEPSMEEGLAAMAPQDSGYAVLKDAYARYRKIDSAGGWPAVAKGGAGKAALSKRLAVEGYLADSAAASTPQSLTAAVKAFQDRHGLTADGTLNTATLTELNVSAADRVKEIALNMERHRWLPRQLGSKYIYVNVPAFRLDAYDSGQKVLTMKVVVGAEYQGKVTPVFSDSMEMVVFRPYWNITPDIQASETGPKAAADPGYLARNDMEYYKDGDATRIRQKPGDKNSLGLVKFLFPNSFNIYLHDTPAKSLFAKTDRAVSHGCIRLEHPDQLGQFVLGWPVEKVRQQMESGPDNKTITLPKKIPVYIVYFTAYERDGQLYFGNDVYSRDDALDQKIDIPAVRPGADSAARKPAKPST
jgi:murein L,D-transpeptidase YcbB/YkuD